MQFRLARKGDGSLGFQQIVEPTEKISGGVYELELPENADKMLLGLYDENMNYLNQDMVKLQEDLLKVEKAFDPKEPRDEKGKWTSDDDYIRSIAIKARREVMRIAGGSEDDCTGHCTEVSEAMLRLLKDKYPKAKIEGGYFIPASKSKHYSDMSDHVWVELPELGVYIDPTYDQYSNVTNSKEKVRIGNLSSKYYADNYKK